MKFIMPSEISGKIMTLLEESDEFAVIVSPYVKVSKWYKLTNKLKSLIIRRVHIEFFVREDSTNEKSYAELDDIDIKYTKVPNLHCKFYFNEKKAIVTSMNLLQSSDTNSLEMAYETETPKEYLEIKQFYERYLKSRVIDKKEYLPQSISRYDSNLNWKDNLNLLLSNIPDSYINIYPQKGHIIVKFNYKTYKAFVASDKTNTLRLAHEIPRDFYRALKACNDELNTDILNFEMYDASRGSKAIIYASFHKPIKSYDLEFFYKDDWEDVVCAIYQFIAKIEEKKRIHGFSETAKIQ